MEHTMNLHLDKNLFMAAIQAASDKLEILPVFIEKDYWITMVLKRLSACKFNNRVVFKGGTSLSKGYKLIDRFSDDIDIALLNVSELSGNQVKTLIRDVVRDISVDLTEIPDHPGTSKGSRFRKSYYSFSKTGDARFSQSISNKLIIEINSFANPFPYEKREIISLIGTSLTLNKQNDLLKKYDLLPFMINVLSKHQTMLEKLVSLFRFSFEENPVAGVSAKIRHFYDLHFLLSDRDCKVFIDSFDFANRFLEVWQHDQTAFDNPNGWKGKAVSQSPLFNDFPALWNSIKATYNRELSGLAYTKLPDEKKISDSITYIIAKLPKV
ncbi:MAG: hypothetical protein BWY70_00620 [Bacteroidetes bacterium ADurb.Bin408]|nr:MAG: hypothetical protein BWY70_00620 [Bacteroidetes bacterium ADurb.Bin408]